MLGGVLGTWANEGAEDWFEMVFKVLLTQPNPSYHAKSKEHSQEVGKLMFPTAKTHSGRKPSTRPP